MLTQIHFILTYRCLFECDHCFVYSGPSAPDDTFTLSQIREALQEAQKIGTVDTVYFEGGEAFLVYPLLIAAVKEARRMGFQVGIVTNAYFATSAENAELWLRPLADLGIVDFSVSDDAFHYSEEAESAAHRAIAAAKKLGLPTAVITIEAPRVEMPDEEHAKGEPIIGGGVVFRGRAVEKLVADLPRRDYSVFIECPYEDLADPGRVHVEPQGHVHLCQGLSMGNMWETPLSELVANYRVETHPVAGPIAAGGPARLAETYDVERSEGYVQACHLCYLVRRQLLDRFPDVLAPANVYGL